MSEHERMTEAEAVQARQALGELAEDVCPWRHAKIEKMVQIGRCVYARPCNHRLYQGRLQ